VGITRRIESGRLSHDLVVRIASRLPAVVAMSAKAALSAAAVGAYASGSSGMFVTLTAPTIIVDQLPELSGVNVGPRAGTRRRHAGRNHAVQRNSK
jgi:hypothetical protein